MDGQSVLEVSMIDEHGTIALEGSLSISLDMKEEALYNAVEDRNYVSEFARKHTVPAGFDY